MKRTAIGQLRSQRVGPFQHVKSFQGQEAAAVEVADQAVHVFLDQIPVRVGVLF
jgi:hypothetical protein